MNSENVPGLYRQILTYRDPGHEDYDSEANLYEHCLICKSFSFFVQVRRKCVDLWPFDLKRGHEVFDEHGQLVPEKYL